MMDLKPVELQIAVPRTNEAGKIQQVQQLKPVLDQQQLAAQNVKQSEQLRIRSNEVDETGKSEIRDEGRNFSSGGQSQAGKGDEQPGAEGSINLAHPAEHPFKGKHIDVSC